METKIESQRFCCVPVCIRTGKIVRKIEMNIKVESFGFILIIKELNIMIWRTSNTFNVRELIYKLREIDHVEINISGFWLWNFAG